MTKGTSTGARAPEIPNGWGDHRHSVVVAVWVLFALLALAVTAASVPVDFERYVTLCADTPGSCLARSQLTPEGLQALGRVGISPGLYAALRVGISTLSKLVWVAVGGLVFLLRPRDRMAPLVSFFLIAFGTATFDGQSMDVLVPAHPALWVPARGLQVVGEVLAALFFLTFPDGRFVPRWTPLLGALFLVFQIPGDFIPGLYRSAPSWLTGLQSLVFLVCVLGMIGAQVYRYRAVATFEQRRQTRWIVFGTTLAISLLLVTLAPLFFVPKITETAYFVALMIGAVIP